MNISMRLITLIFLLIAPSFVAAELEWPDTKYEMGTCITPQIPLGVGSDTPAVSKILFIVNLQIVLLTK